MSQGLIESNAKSCFPDFLKDSEEIAGLHIEPWHETPKTPFLLRKFDANVLNFAKLDDFLFLTFPILNLTMMYQISGWRIVVGLDDGQNALCIKMQNNLMPPS